MIAKPSPTVNASRSSPGDRRGFEKAAAQLTPSEYSYIVIVTRGHRDDMRMLRWAVQTPARYVGMIGSKRKTITIFKELQLEGLPGACSTAFTLRSDWISAPSLQRKSPSRSPPN